MKQYKPIVWAQGQINEAGGMQETFPNRPGRADLTQPVQAMNSQPAKLFTKASRRRRHLLWLILPAAIVGAVGYQMGTESTYISSYLANALFANNFHEVVAGKLYRSAQMSRYELIETIRVNGIKTVIDLRLNEDEVDHTGLTEAEAVREGGAQYRHIPFSSARIDQRRSLLALLAAYSDAPTPILVHCSSGTHRSGVASAIWLMDKEGQSPNLAADQLTIKYGFFQPERDLKAFLQGQPTLDRAISEYAVALRKQPISFREWVVTTPILGSDVKKVVDRETGSTCADGMSRLGAAITPTRSEEQSMTPVCRL